MKKFTLPNEASIIFIIIAFAIGFLAVAQFRSYARVEETFMRDSNPNLFREIKILKGVTDQLDKERAELEKSKDELSSRASRVESQKKELAKYRLLSGTEEITGPGISLSVPKIIPTVWMTDIVNELVTAGAEAIAVNGVRIGPGQAGFRVISEDTLLLGDRVLHAPLRIQAIGEPKTLSSALLLPGSVLSRLESTLKDVKTTLAEELALKFEKIP